VRVVVADDDATCRHVAAAAVERLGHECIPVDDGEQAWSTLQDRLVDVLITDWMMPRLDGPELCRRVRDRAEGQYTYIIIVTSLGENEDVVAGMEAGADDYLTKPLDPFAVQTRLIAAARVTALHRQLGEFRAQLESLNAQLADQARTDPLTSLGNRLRLHEDLAEVQRRARRSDVPYALAICDLDDFKRYNDLNGHLEGDEALRRVAAAIAASCRVTDRAYRYGGEEFVILYEDTMRGAAVAAERLRRAVEALAIRHAGKPPPGVLTVSIGVAAGHHRGDGDSVLRAADAALYQAKEEGRNRVVGPDSTGRRSPAAESAFSAGG